MDRSAFRKRLRRMHRLLVNSRYALERTSGVLGNKWVRDLLFMFACRRVIMLNRLDRELGILGLPLKSSSSDMSYFDRYVGSTARTVSPERCVDVCEEEEKYLKRELEDLMEQPGLHGHTRQMIADLLDEAQQNLNDLRDLRVNILSLHTS
jgi:hypothetical protein